MVLLASVAYFFLRSGQRVVRTGVDFRIVFGYLSLLALAVMPSLFLPGGNPTGTLLAAGYQALVLLWCFLLLQRWSSQPEFATDFAASIFLFAIVAAIGVLVTTQIGQFALGPLNFRMTHNRPYGWFAGPNFMGSALGLGIVAGLYLAYTQQRFRGLSALGVAVICFALVVSGSRGAIAASAPGVLAMLVSSPRARLGIADLRVHIRGSTFRLAVGAAVGVAATIYLLRDVLSTYLARFTERADVIDAGGRRAIWEEGLYHLDSTSLPHFLFGHGRGAFAEVVGRHAHNSYLAAAYDFGAIWLLFFLLLTGLALCLTWRHRGVKGMSLFFGLLIFTLTMGFTAAFFFSPRIDALIYVASIIAAAWHRRFSHSRSIRRRCGP